MDKTTEDILDALDFVKERMATKSDMAEMRLGLESFRSESGVSFRSLATEIRDITRRLDVLATHFGNLKGVTKEIDDLRERIRAIEKHLGMAKKIAA